MIKFQLPSRPVKLTKHQRQELVEYVQQQCEQKIKNLRSKIPDKPNLKFYLSNAISNGTIKFKSHEHLLKFMQKTVKSSYRGIDDVITSSRYSDSLSITFDVEDFFDIPEEYIDDYKKWELEASNIAMLIKQLEDNLNITRLKIQVGSDEALQQLVSEIDNLGGHLTIMGDPNSTNLLLSDGNK